MNVPAIEFPQVFPQVGGSKVNIEQAEKTPTTPTTTTTTTTVGEQNRVGARKQCRRYRHVCSSTCKLCKPIQRRQLQLCRLVLPVPHPSSGSARRVLFADVILVVVPVLVADVIVAVLPVPAVQATILFADVLLALLALLGLGFDERNIL
jgi:hypothetical protein